MLLHLTLGLQSRHQVRAMSQRNEIAPVASSLEAGLLQAVLDFSPACMILAEAPSGKIIYINKAARKFREKTDAPLTDITLEQYVLSWKNKFPNGTLMKREEIPLVRTLSHGEMVTNEKVIVEMDSGEEKWALMSAAPIHDNTGAIVAGIIVWLDVTEYKEQEIGLPESRSDFDALSGILPICAHCKNIRDDSGGWNRIESYIRDHSAARFTHGICPECIKKHYAEVDEREELPCDLAPQTDLKKENLVQPWRGPTFRKG